MSRKTKPKPGCSHLLGTVLRTIDGIPIIAYVTDWANLSESDKQTGKFNYCPTCGQRVNGGKKGGKTR